MPKDKQDQQEHQIDTWNEFVIHMLNARKAWGKHLALCMKQRMTSVTGPSGKDLPGRAIRALAGTYNRAKFDIALPRLVDYWRASGGLEGLHFPEAGSNFERQLVKNKKGGNKDE